MVDSSQKIINTIAKQNNIDLFGYKFDFINPNYEIEYLKDSDEKDSDEKDWEIVFVDTGQETLKGGRIKRVEKYVNSDLVHITYGDGIGNINIESLLEFHKSHGKLATLTAVRPPSRFGEINLTGNQVVDFKEKPKKIVIFY